MTVEYINKTNHSFDFSEEEILSKLTSAAMEYLGCPYEVSVSVSLVSENEIKELNRSFRQIDSPTDVLSFPTSEFDVPGDFRDQRFLMTMSKEPDSDEVFLGDVVLCLDRVVSQAEEYGHTELREFSFLVIHSLLHLCGYDHMTDEESRGMEHMQEFILDSLGIGR